LARDVGCDPGHLRDKRQDRGREAVDNRTGVLGVHRGLVGNDYLFERGPIVIGELASRCCTAESGN
jgi:hypothetical protein